MAAPTPTTTAHGDEEQDVRDLRREVARLTAENERLRAATDHAAAGAPADAAARLPRHRGRAFLSVALVVVASLLVPVGVVGVWLQTVLTDTDRYVETVAPLVRDPTVQRAAATRVSDALLQKVDLEPRVADALPADARFLATPLTSGIETLVRDLAGRIVASDRFAQLWDQANRLAHEQVVAVLENRSGEAGVVKVDLTGVVAEAGKRLSDLGLSFFAGAGKTPLTFTLVQSEGIAHLQAAFSVFERLATLLPWAVIALYGGAVAAATDRRRAVVRAGGGVMAGALVLLLGLAAARSLYLGSLPVGASVRANEVIFDTLTRFLRGGGRTVLAIGVVMAAAAALSGPGAAAMALRRWTARLLDRAGTEAGAHGLSTGPVGAFAAQHLPGLRAGVGLASVLVLLGMDRPSGGTILWLGVATAAALLVVELLARTGAAADAAEPVAGQPTVAEPTAGPAGTA